jgi:hypothetical protein
MCRSRWGLVTVVLGAVALGATGCAFIDTGSRLVATSSPGEIRDYGGPDPHSAIYSSMPLRQEVSVELAGAELVLSIDNETRRTVMLGPVLPIVPVFFIGESSRLDSGSPVARIDVYPRDHDVRMDLTHFVIESDQYERAWPPESVEFYAHPVTPEGTEAPVRRGAKLVPLESLVVHLPSDELYVRDDGSYGAILRYESGYSELESFSMTLGGVTVDGTLVEPLSVGFALHSGWEWSVFPAILPD